MVAAWRRSPASAVPPEDLVMITDFDGTLADIVPDPNLAAALPESLDALRRLVQRLADVIVLSARTNEQLEQLVPISGVRLIGDSGRALPRHAQKEALDRFNSHVAMLLERIPGAWLEIKPASSAIHYRNADLGGEELLTLIAPLLDDAHLGATLGRKVIEVHARKSGKGSALAALVPGLDPGGIVCFGDDANDRSMFEFVSSLDIPNMCVGVNSPEAPAHLFDRCELLVSGPTEAALFMNTIAEWAAPT